MRLSLLPLLAALTLPLSASAADLLSYYFNGNLSPILADGYEGSGFLANGGSKAIVGLGNNNGSYGYILLKKSTKNANEAVSNAQFAQFSLTPPKGQTVQLGGFSFTASRGGNSTPRGVVLRSSLDGYKSNLGEAQVNTTWPGTKNLFFPLSLTIGSQITFRLYAYANQQNGIEPSVRLTKVVVQGSQVIYPPTVTPAATLITTSRPTAMLKGTAGGTLAVSRVEVAKNNVNATYSGANGTYNWNFPVTGLKPGRNVFYVRAIDSAGNIGGSVQIVVRRSGSGPGPGPGPSPTP